MRKKHREWIRESNTDEYIMRIDSSVERDPGPAEIQAFLTGLAVRGKVSTSLLYGSGLRISECLQSRVQELLGHSNVKTAQIYTHVLQRAWSVAKTQKRGACSY